MILGLQDIYSHRLLKNNIDRHRSPDQTWIGSTCGDRIAFSRIIITSLTQAVAFLALDALSTSLKMFTSVFYFTQAWQSLRDKATEYSDEKYGALVVAWIASLGLWKYEMARDKYNKIQIEVNNKIDELIKEKALKFEIQTKKVLGLLKKCSSEKNLINSEQLSAQIKRFQGDLQEAWNASKKRFKKAAPTNKYVAWKKAKKETESALQNIMLKIENLPFKEDENEFYMRKYDAMKMGRTEYQRMINSIKLDVPEKQQSTIIGIIRKKGVRKTLADMVEKSFKKNLSALRIQSPNFKFEQISKELQTNISDFLRSFLDGIQQEIDKLRNIDQNSKNVRKV